MKKLIALLVLSIAITGMAYAPPEPLEPPVVSIGEQPMEAVATSLTSVPSMDCRSLVIPMEQSEVLDNVSALTPQAYVATSAAAVASGCDLQRGTTLPTLTNPLTKLPQHGREILSLYRTQYGTLTKMYAPEVAGLSSMWLVLLLK